MQNRLPFSAEVQNPWNQGSRHRKEFFTIRSIVYRKGEFFISDDMPDCSHLYFKKIGSKYYAFNNLVGYTEEHIEEVINALLGKHSDNWIAIRGAQCIEQWREKL